MTRDEAYNEAVRRYRGDGGFISIQVRHKDKPKRYAIWRDGAVIGEGDSWESAFADDDARAREGK